MKPNRIFKTTETPNPAVDAVLNHGFAAIDHDTSLALPFGKRVIEALKPYDIEPHLDYVADFFVVDLNRFPLSERRGRLSQAIQALT
ncbi:MAG: hypothetical protein RSP_17400 [Rhodanobacter sp.]